MVEITENNINKGLTVGEYEKAIKAFRETLGFYDTVFMLDSLDKNDDAYVTPSEFVENRAFNTIKGEPKNPEEAKIKAEQQAANAKTLKDPEFLKMFEVIQGERKTHIPSSFVITRKELIKAANDFNPKISVKEFHELVTDKIDFPVIDANGKKLETRPDTKKYDPEGDGVITLKQAMNIFDELMDGLKIKGLVKTVSPTDITPPRDPADKTLSE